MTNPLLEEYSIPPFDRILPEHVRPAILELIGRVEKSLPELEESCGPGWEGTAGALEALMRPLETAWRAVGHLVGVQNSPELRDAQASVMDEVVALDQRLRQSRPLYLAMLELERSPGFEALDEARQRALRLRLRDARLCGVGLEGQARERFNAVEQELSRLAHEFSNHLLDATKAFELLVEDPEDTRGWPAGMKAQAARSYARSRGEEGRDEGEGPWRISLEGPSYLPFMQHCRNRALRERLYRAFITRASGGETDNSELIRRILQLRSEKARLLGFSCYAELSLESKTAPDLQAIRSMFARLEQAARPHGRDELLQLRELSEARGQQEPLAHWDLAFWAERLREERFRYTDEEIRPYFPLERVLEGLFALSGRLFGIRIEPADGEAPLWHPDVRYFRVRDESGEILAHFYLDPYSRPETKRGGAWMDECLPRLRERGGRLQLPVVHLCCNGTPPLGEVPSLMSFAEVETLFHEFGHGLQGMLTQIDCPDVSGINGIEWDAVEVASQFMENWCYHRATLMGMSGHYRTAEPLPAELFEKILAGRSFRAASRMLRQLEFALTDLRLHCEFDPGGEEDAFEVHRRIACKLAPVVPLPEDRFLCSFSHIFAGGYAAGYYSYKWAEVLSADAFAAFEEAGLENEEALCREGRRLRGTLLGLGGSLPPMEVFERFRGRGPSIEALLRHNRLEN